MKYLVLLVAFILVTCKDKEKNSSNSLKNNEIKLENNGKLHENRDFTQSFDIKSSSNLYDKNDRYNSGNIILENADSWCEGNKNDGIGEYIEFNLKPSISTENLKFDRFYIYNGFGDLDFYFKNNRVKDLTLETDLGIKQNISLKDTHNLQEIILNDPMEFKNTIKFTIKNIYKGTHFNDTCIHKLMLDESILYFSNYRFEVKGSEENLWTKRNQDTSKCLDSEINNFPNNFEEGCLLNCDPNNGPDYSIFLMKDNTVETHFFGCAEGCNPQWEFKGTWEKTESAIYINAEVSNFPVLGCYASLSSEECYQNFYEWFNKKYKTLEKTNITLEIRINNDKQAIVSKEIIGVDKNEKVVLKLKEEGKNYGCIKK